MNDVAFRKPIRQPGLLYRNSVWCLALARPIIIFAPVFAYEHLLAGQSDRGTLVLGLPTRSPAGSMGPPTSCSTARTRKSTAASATSSGERLSASMRAMLASSPDCQRARVSGQAFALSAAHTDLEPILPGFGRCGSPSSQGPRQARTIVLSTYPGRFDQLCVPNKLMQPRLGTHLKCAVRVRAIGHCDHPADPKAAMVG